MPVLQIPVRIAKPCDLVTRQNLADLPDGTQ